MLINIYKGKEVLSNQTLFKNKKFCIPEIQENKKVQRHLVKKHLVERHFAAKMID
jgi:hypothetical protein